MTLFDNWQGWSEAFVAWGRSSLIGTVVVFAAVALIWVAVRRRSAPQLACWLFFLVLLKPFVLVQVAMPYAFSERVSSLMENVGISGEISQAGVVDDTTGLANEPNPSASAAVALQTSPSEVVSISQSVAPTPANDMRTETALPQQPIQAWALPSWKAVLAAIYLTVVVTLLLRFLWAQLRFHRSVLRAKQLPATSLPIDLADVCRRAGLRKMPRVVEMGEVSSPAVWGWTQPTLVLPIGLIDTLSGESLRWTLLHEFAHLRRHDIVINAAQRLLLILQFWNPLAWLASRSIDRHRELACDDLALLWSGRKAVPAGEAFAEIVRFASSVQKPQMANALGVFSSGSRRECVLRLKRLLDTDRTLRSRFGPFAMLTFICASIVLMPQLHRALAAEEEASVFVPASETGEIELVVVGPDKEPVAGASVELRSHPKPDWEILTGTFVRKAKYGTFTKTDKNGRLKVKLPSESLHHMNFSIRASGYGPFWAGWSLREKSEMLPAKYTANLDAGRSVGGVIVDEKGDPVVGAKVHPRIKYKKRETDKRQLGSGWSTKTDEKGRWRSDSIPASMDSVAISIAHPKFEPTTKGIAVGEFGLEMDETPTKTITIDRGATIAGKVVDGSGQPIKDAAVRFVARNETRKAETDEKGRYEIPGCPEGNFPLTVTAETFSPDQRMLKVRRDMPSEDFALEPGHTIRVRVVDKDGNPEKKARIFFRKWREDTYGEGLGMVHAYTDENGIWEWNEAPPDRIVADICPHYSVQIGKQVLMAREDEYVFTSVRELEIRGNVTDAKTGKPLPVFRVTPGLLWPGRTAPLMEHDSAFDGRDGKFSFRANRMDGRHAIRVEADGYLAKLGRAVAADEGVVELEWKLEAAENIEIDLKRPDGSPASGAKVAIGEDQTQIGVREAKFEGTFADQLTADEQGHIAIKPQSDSFLLVVLDKTGFTETVLEPEEVPTEVTLTPWATIKGEWRNGAEPARRTQLSYSPNSMPFGRAPNGRIIRAVDWDYRIKTDDLGSFQIDYVVPRRGLLCRTVNTHITARSRRSAWANFYWVHPDAGKTLEQQFGGDGRRVVGKALAPKKLLNVDWNFSMATMETFVAQPPPVPIPKGLDRLEKERWREEWLKTVAGKQWKLLATECQERRKNARRFASAIDEDGFLQFDDVPPGKYQFEIQLDVPKANFFGQPLGSYKSFVEIESADDAADAQQLGELELVP